MAVLSSAAIIFYSQRIAQAATLNPCLSSLNVRRVLTTCHHPSFPASLKTWLMSVVGEQVVRLRNNDCLELAALTFLYYDHLITFPDEVARIWSRPFSRPSFLFYLNRYIPFFGNIAVSVFTFSDLASTDKSCRNYGLARQLLLVFNQVLVSLLLAMRIMALYGNTRRFVVFIIGTGCMLFIVACWSLFGQHSSPVEGISGCHIAISTITGIHLAAAWEAQAVFDLLVFALTIRKTLQTRESMGRRLSFTGVGIVDLVYRDGAIYFA
ncbi:hypothetical protein BV25DRAFT_1825981 [Artomyces pyxidatus]|uniref:Uncharacterized protein n=1 Tax=Artomyces pyxidatus TaxID=48021 RepID=A0ACB8T083_9AGAM|nr:hypothetical protein BV25DRAFT_1825981 [Artomyces pyxidatus]